MPKIFISYRREDSKHAVGRLYGALKKHVKDPKRDIFIDIDNIPRGVDFVDHLDAQVAQCDILLAVIGPGWLTVSDPKTQGRRLDDPNDFVRIEIASALKRNIPVVPVVLDETRIPSAAELPDDLRALSRRNGERLEHESFDGDVARLIANLPGPAPKPKAPPRRESTRTGDASWRAPVISLSLLAVVGAGVLIVDPLRWRGATPSAGGVDQRSPSPGSTSTPASAPSATSAPMSIPAAAQTYAAGQIIRDRLSDGADGPQMVVVPAGSFTMGSPSGEAGRYDDEGPQHRVEIGYQFALGKYEVTWAEYNSCVSDGGCTAAKDDGYGGGNRPVTNVSWGDAKAYAKWLTRKSGKTYRLTSEAEWEYAARAGAQTAYPWGGAASHADANYGKDECCDGMASGVDRWVNTSPVGSFDANRFGLYDTAGNVSEWVEDCYEAGYTSGQPTDGRAYTSGSCSYRVDRSGSWSDSPQNLRSAVRFRGAPATRSNILGFRLARTLP